MLGTTINGSDLSATALYEVVPQAPPIATPWKKLHDYGASVDTMGNTAISADGRYVSPNASQMPGEKAQNACNFRPQFHAILRGAMVPGVGTSRVSTVDVTTGAEVASVPLADPKQSIVDLVSC